jgi:hypothetical protein
VPIYQTNCGGCSTTTSLAKTYTNMCDCKYRNSIFNQDKQIKKLGVAAGICSCFENLFKG